MRIKCGRLLGSPNLVRKCPSLARGSAGKSRRGYLCTARLPPRKCPIVPTARMIELNAAPPAILGNHTVRWPADGVGRGRASTRPAVQAVAAPPRQAHAVHDGGQLEVAGLAQS